MKAKILITAAIFLPGLSLAQPAGGASTARISEVFVYPGGATVERLATVAAGAQQLRLNCLPASFDLDSMQVQADAGIRVGDVSVQTVERARAPECASSPLDTRIRELEDQVAALDAENGAQDLALAFLKSYGGDASGKSATGTANIAATTEALKRSGLDALQRQHQLLRRKQDLELQLKPLLAERERSVRANPQLRNVLIRLSTAQGGAVRLSYRLSQAGWTPVYRAYLDTSKSQLRLERHAQVAQSSGEDWTGVKLRLSTVQPRLASSPPPLEPWTLDIQPPVVATAGLRQRSMAFAAAPAPAEVLSVMETKVVEEAISPSSFDVSVFQGAFSAEFEVPGRVSVSSDGQKVAFALGQSNLEAQVLRRVQPQQDAQAYLLADLARPEGSWPRGSLQLFRDGSFVGESELRLASDERLELFFGRDELLRVLVEPEQRGGANAGFIGNRAEQKLTRSYVLENLHKQPVSVQVLEASPVSRHEDIRVQAVFAPKPTQDAWKKQPGVVAWLLPLAAGQSQRITADYLISYPKDVRINGLR